MSFEGKVVLITGASCGIGAAAALHFSELGASLSLHGRNVQNLQNVADQCKGPKPLIVTGEITNEVDVKNILDSTLQKYGKLDILINNAGIFGTGSIENTSLEQFDKIFNVNVRAIYHLTMLAVPHLIKTKGNIVNVSSAAGTRAFPGALSYCMSKSAVDQFTRCVALELADRQVRVNSVNPGVIETNIYKYSGMSDEILKSFYEHNKTMNPLGRNGTRDDVAKTIAFLASEDASFITGQNLPIDGGRSVMCSK